jgi:hypothetical protein
MAEQHVTRCGQARQEFITQAVRLDPRYPEQEARAAADALLGLDLDRLAQASGDEPSRGGLQAASREAFERAHRRFRELAVHSGARQLRRYLLGTARGMAE